MTSSHHAPYTLGYTRATMGSTESRKPARGELISENYSQFGLYSATRVHEVGIASNRKSAMLR